MRLIAAVLLLASSVVALKRPLSALFAEHQEQLNLAKSSRQVRVVGGLLDEHVIRSEWSTMDRELVHLDDAVSFSIQLKQCNLDVLKNLVEQVSNPRHENYQNYMTSADIDDFVHCGEPTDKAKEDIPEWLHSNGIRNDQIYASNAYIHVNKATVSQIENLFDVQMFYRAHKKSKTVMLRARGLLEMPIAISDHVEFISGLTELVKPSKAMRVSSQPEPEEGYGPRMNEFIEDIPIVPRVLRRMYNIRMNLTGGTASNNSIAIAAFNDWFYEEDLCYAFDVFGRDSNDESLYPVAPSVNYNGPQTGDDNGESALDIEMATLMAYNVSISFYNHEPEIWILSWVQQTINLTDGNGPWVWSVSYGWPEIAHCTQGDMSDPAQCSKNSFNYMSYIETTNNEFMKLALMGVTVFVSSGDSGSPGFTIYCPVDASKRQNWNGGYDLHHTCPSENPTDCHCGSYVLSYTDNSTGEPNFCILPNLFQGDVVYNQIGGMDACTIINSDFAYNQTINVTQQWVSSMNSTCPSKFNEYLFTFGSTCTCDVLPPGTFEFIINSTTNESIPVTLSGYVYNTSYATSIFYSNFPASSPYVVSVGATMIDPFKAQDACAESSAEIFSTIDAGSGITGGGGFSILTPRPSWQNQMVEAYLNSSELPPAGFFNMSTRGYPDISLNGHHYAIVTNRTLGYVDGTSCSSPVTASMFALMNEVLLSNGKKPLGLLSPLLYMMAVDQPGAFNKITSATYFNETFGGDNACTETYCCQYGFKTSSSGWDPVTGLGTPNMEVIENYIRAMNNLPSIAQEAAANQPTSSPTTMTTSAPSPTQVPETSRPTTTPTSSSGSNSGANSASTGAVTKTVTTAGAVTIAILCGFFGAVGAFMLTKIRSSGPSDGYTRAQ
jgi:subtilase family serine protease